MGGVGERPDPRRRADPRISFSTGLFSTTGEVAVQSTGVWDFHQGKKNNVLISAKFKLEAQGEIGDSLSSPKRFLE